jgi:hypothetical protein
MQGAASPKKKICSEQHEFHVRPGRLLPSFGFFFLVAVVTGVPVLPSQTFALIGGVQYSRPTVSMCLLCGGEHDKVFLPCMEAACRIAFHAAQIRADYLTSSALGSFRFQVWIACVAPER